MKIFVTADHHFHHKNIIEYCKRPFKSVEKTSYEPILLEELEKKIREKN